MFGYYYYIGVLLPYTDVFGAILSIPRFLLNDLQLQLTVRCLLYHLLTDCTTHLDVELNYVDYIMLNSERCFLPDFFFPFPI